MNSDNVRLQLIIPVEVDTAFRVEAARQRTTISALAAEAFKFYLTARANDSDRKPAPVEEDEDELMSFAPAVA